MTAIPWSVSMPDGRLSNWSLDVRSLQSYAFIMDVILGFLPFVITVLVVTLILRIAHWLLLKRVPELGNERKFPRQLFMLGLTIAGIVMIAMALPVGISTRNQVIAFMGLVVSGIFAFSSTTVFANLMAGLMMRVTQPFRAGDFIEVANFSGRVSERGLLDTEIQTEDRQLIAIPNTFLITHPVSVIRSSGTIVSAVLSLGYDIHHSRITSLLKQAAGESGLEEPFVHITQLGDFSVSYRVNGMLKEVKHILTARSRLNAAILDTLHKAGIEIVSPGFMNQRPLKEGQQFIPEQVQAEPEVIQTSAEAIVFDKADAAEERELTIIRLKEEITRREESLGDAEEALQQRLKEEISVLKERLRDIEQTKE